ncbi:MAG: hypothetical protein U5J97_01630 [Trueperaceae bacterium]|nr:hypothetical protein [Trueperaceae bacterium]
MTRPRTPLSASLSALVISALLLAALAIGTASASGIAFDASAFDAFDSDEGYVDLIRDGDTLIVTFDEKRGDLPATMEGDALPLDEDFDEFRLVTRDALALYGGLAVQSGADWLTIDVEGDPSAIHDAVLARLAQLGVTAEEDFAGGKVASYRCSDGEAEWRLSFSPYGDHAVIHIQAL